MLWEFMQYKGQTRTQESSVGRNCWKQLWLCSEVLQKQAPSFGNRAQEPGNGGQLDMNPSRQEQIGLFYSFLFFVFLISCFSVLKLNPFSKKSEVTWLNSLLIHDYNWCSYWMSWLKCSLKTRVERWWDSWWGNDHHSSKMSSVTAPGREYTGVICSSWFCFKGL